MEVLTPTKHQTVMDVNDLYLASAILSMEIQLVLGGISSSNPSSMKVSR
jgi:hypothetical protein